MPVAVEIADLDTGPVLEDVGECVASALEGPVPVIQVKSWPQSVFAAPELVPAAHHEQIRMSIAVRIEEGGANILGYAVCRDRRLAAGAERTITLLNEQFPRLPL